MPIYEYVCATCEYKFDTLQAMDAPGADCPRCSQPARKAISLFSAVTAGGDGEMGSVAGMGGCSSGACSSCACAID